MSRVIIVYGPIGSGKTTTCLELAERARSDVAVAGIITSLGKMLWDTTA
jgi:nucleoside-triphosphatase THEP1